MIDFSEVEVVNIENLSEKEILALVKKHELKTDSNKLFLFLPYKAEANLIKNEKEFILKLNTEIENKEDMEYFLESIVNINTKYPNLFIEIYNNIKIDNLQLPKEIIEKN